jgi:hypothetical protein
MTRSKRALLEASGLLNSKSGENADSDSVEVRQEV